MARHHVHLSSDPDTAWQVASRHRLETPLVLRVDARRMSAEGFSFFQSSNGVWLVDRVPTVYLSVAERPGKT